MKSLKTLKDGPMTDAREAKFYGAQCPDYPNCSGGCGLGCTFEINAGAPHKVMTPEEYAAMPLKGWHEVCRDVDGFGGVGVRFMGEPTRSISPTTLNSWQPIETAPKDGTQVLLWAESWEMSWGIQLGHFEFDEWQTSEGSVADNDEDFDPGAEVFDESSLDLDRNTGPTHWMPLPAPPKETP